MEAGNIKEVSRLIGINGGGWLVLTAFVNTLTEAVAVREPPRLMED
jgi:hypothetical protein